MIAWSSRLLYKILYRTSFIQNKKISREQTNKICMLTKHRLELISTHWWIINFLKASKSSSHPLRLWFSSSTFARHWRKCTTKDFLVGTFSQVSISRWSLIGETASGISNRRLNLNPFQSVATRYGSSGCCEKFFTFFLGPAHVTN